MDSPDGPRPRPSGAAQGGAGGPGPWTPERVHILGSYRGRGPAWYSRLDVAHFGRQHMLFPGCHADVLFWGPPRSGPPAFTQGGLLERGVPWPRSLNRSRAAPPEGERPLLPGTAGTKRRLAGRSSTRPAKYGPVLSGRSPGWERCSAADIVAAAGRPGRRGPPARLRPSWAPSYGRRWRASCAMRLRTARPARCRSRLLRTR